jgi:hypothetical protein
MKASNPAYPVYPVKLVSPRLWNPVNAVSVHISLRSNAIEEGSVQEYGYSSLFCAESQALPESKGEALGQWQHGPGEATSGLVGFFGTGCHVDSELRLSPIL